MIQDYLDFNIAKFVADCFEHERMLPSLIEELNDLDGLKAIDTSKEKVQSNSNNNGMINLVIVRQRLSDRITNYQKDISLLKAAMTSLSENEREAITICFNGKNVKQQCDEYFIDERTLYHRRKRALDKLAKAIMG